MNSTSSKNIDNLQASVESWITNLDSLEIYSLDRALKPVSEKTMQNIELNNLYQLDTSPCISDLIVRRNPTSGEILDFYEDFKENNVKEDQISLNLNEDSFYLDGLLNEIPTVGMGIDFSKKSDILQQNDANMESNMVDLTKALFQQSFDDSLLNISTHSYLDESSLASLSFQQNENEITLSELLTNNENEDSQIAELFTKKADNSSSRSSSGSSSPNIDDLISKRKVKKYAIEADLKLVKNFDEIKPKLAHQWEFELDVFQKQAVYLMENSENVFVAAHTSAGKTVVAEYAIALSFKHKTKVIYTSPIKALSNQKFREFKTVFDDVGLITGDIQIAPEASCLIMTTEILRSMLYKRSETLHDLEWVIFDEVHYMNDAHRGVVWEEVLILLPDHINIVMLSATIPNHMEFAEWVGKIKQRPIYVMSTKKRPVPLEHFLYTGNSQKTSNELHLLIDANNGFLAKNYNKAVECKSERSKASAGKFGPKGTKQTATPAQEKNIWISIIGMLEKKQLLPVVAFTFSRKRCDDNIYLLNSLDLNTQAEKSRIHLFIHKSLSSLSKEDQSIPQIIHLTESLSRGIGVHHSGILPIMKEIIELLFQMGLIKVLFATETFAMGINMPARTVIFDSIRKHDGTKFRSLQTSEYIQMAGRAGRRGLDSTGTVIILCKNEVPDMGELQNIMQGKAQTLESKFRITYSMILSLLRKKDMRIQDFMRRSFSEHKMTSTAESPAVYEAAKIYLAEKLDAFVSKCKKDCGIEICSFCNENKMRDYYNLCAEYYDSSQELLERLIVNGQVFKSLVAGRVVFIKSVRKQDPNDTKKTYNLTPVILVEGFNKDKTYALAISLDEVTLTKTSDDELWDEDDSDKMAGYYDINPTYESLIEKLKNFRSNEVEIPFLVNSLALYRSIQNATLIQVKYHDIQFISTKIFQKSTQLSFDFSFNSTWLEMTGLPSNQQVSANQRNIKFIQNLNRELHKNTSFVTLAIELQRFTETYAPLTQDISAEQFLLQTNLVLDFTKDLNIREVQFVELFENYKRIVKKLAKSSCLDCPKFDKHFEEVKIESSINDRINYVNDVISGNSLLLVSEYRYRIEVLKKYRLIDDKNFVLLKGKVALEISMSELLITELIIENVFSQMQPCEIVSLLSAIVYQQKSNQDDENFFKTSFNNAVLDQGRDKMIQIAQQLNNVQKECQLLVGSEDDYLEQLNFGLVPVVYEWCKGISFVKITNITDVQEGIIVRTIQRLDELCSNLRNAARIIGDTVLESKIEQCSVLIRRDIVFAGSLYTK